MLHEAAIAHGRNFIILLPLAEHGDLEMLLYGRHIGANGSQFRDTVREIFRKDQFKVRRDLLSQSHGIAHALRWLHHNLGPRGGASMYCAHMDLKPSNILIRGSNTSSVGEWKLSDFGISVIHENHGLAKTKVRTIRDVHDYSLDLDFHTMRVSAQRAGGTYQAPEVQSEGFAKVGRRSDVWSFICVYSEIVTFSLGGEDLVKAYVDRRSSKKDGTGFYSRGGLLGGSIEDSSVVHPEVNNWLRDLVFKYKTLGPWVNQSVKTIQQYLIPRLSDRPDSQGLPDDLQRICKKMESPGSQSTDSHDSSHAKGSHIVRDSSPRAESLGGPPADHSHRPLTFSNSQHLHGQVPEVMVNDCSTDNDSGLNHHDTADLAARDSLKPATDELSNNHRSFFELCTKIWNTKTDPQSNFRSINDSQSRAINSAKRSGHTSEQHSQRRIAHRHRRVSSQGTQSLVDSKREHPNGKAGLKTLLMQANTPSVPAIDVSVSSYGRLVAWLFPDHLKTASLNHGSISYSEENGNTSVFGSCGSTETQNLETNTSWQGIAIEEPSTDTVTTQVVAVWGRSGRPVKNTVKLFQIAEAGAMINGPSPESLHSLILVSISALGDLVFACEKHLLFTSFTAMKSGLWTEQELLKPIMDRHNFSHASFSETGAYLYAWSYGPEYCYFYIWDILDHKTVAYEPIPYEMGADIDPSSTLLPYNKDLGCIIRAKGETVFFPAQFPYTERGEVIPPKKHEKVITSAVGARVVEDCRLLTVENHTLSRHPVLSEYILNCEGDHTISSHGSRLCQLRSKKHVKCCISISKNQQGDTVRMIICNLDGTVEVVDLDAVDLENPISDLDSGYYSGSASFSKVSVHSDAVDEFVDCLGADIEIKRLFAVAFSKTTDEHKIARNFGLLLRHYARRLELAARTKLENDAGKMVMQCSIRAAWQITSMNNPMKSLSKSAILMMDPLKKEKIGLRRKRLNLVLAHREESDEATPKNKPEPDLNRSDELDDLEDKDPRREDKDAPENRPETDSNRSDELDDLEDDDQGREDEAADRIILEFLKQFMIGGSAFKELQQDFSSFVHNSTTQRFLQWRQTFHEMQAFDTYRQASWFAISVEDTQRSRNSEQRDMFYLPIQTNRNTLEEPRKTIIVHDETAQEIFKESPKSLEARRVALSQNSDDTRHTSMVPRCNFYCRIEELWAGYHDLICFRRKQCAAAPKGFKEIQWKCSCGRQFIHHVVEHSGTSNESKHPQNRTETTPSNKNSTWSDSQQSEQPRDGRVQKAVAPEEPDSAARSCSKEKNEPIERWIILLVPYLRHGKKAFHLKIQGKKPDVHLFNEMRKIYYEERSWWSRFKGLKAVKDVHFVHFYLTEAQRASLRAKGSWPPEHHKEDWNYMPCPPPKDDQGRITPLVPSDWMLHRWYCPEHFIPLEDESRNVFSETYLRQFDLRQRAPNVPTDLDCEEGASRDTKSRAQFWVFTSTPKKTGEELSRSTWEDDVPPEGWCLYIEEGFRISWAFIAALVIYVLGSVCFAIAWLVKYGTNASEAGFDVFGVTSWLVTLLTLIVTVWFASTRD